MRNIGIDVSKEKIDVFLEEKKYLKLPNTKEGFNILLKELQTGDVLGVESTGIYHHELALFFLKKKYEVREINPILTKQFIRATVRKKKTDKSDAKIISLLLAQEEGYLMKKENIKNVLQKTLRAKRKLIQMRTSLKIQVKSLPEGKEFYCIKKSLHKLISVYDKQIEVLEKESLKEKNNETKILESIPGVSPNISREILTELKDISRFEKKKQVVAYGGYDPSIKRSGTSVNITGKLTKRGSPYLRNALYRAVFANLRSNNAFSLYYKKKKSEGKHHYQAMTATSRKMLEIAFSLLQKNQSFSLDFS